MYVLTMPEPIKQFIIHAILLAVIQQGLLLSFHSASVDNVHSWGTHSISHEKYSQNVNEKAKEAVGFKERPPLR